MTVLVDDATWWWRGDRWAHLASDSSAGELHRFANRLGIRRLAFQDDHYDVPIAVRDRAIAAGATPVSSRVLVKALRDEGLRVRGRSRWREGSPALSAPERRAVAKVADHWPLLRDLAWTTVLRRPGELACSLTIDVVPVSADDVPAAIRDLAYLVQRPEGAIVDVVLEIDG